MVQFNEYACAKLGRISWIIEGIDCGGASANPGCLKDGDVDGERRGFGVEIRVIAKVVCD